MKLATLTALVALAPGAAWAADFSGTWRLDNLFNGQAGSGLAETTLVGHLYELTGSHGVALRYATVWTDATINTAFSRPELFRYVVIMSAGAPANVDQLYPSFFGASGAAAKALRLVWVSAGSEDFALNGSKTLDEALTKNGIKHSFTTRAGYRHEWRLWRQDLWEFAPLLFKEPAKGTN